MTRRPSHIAKTADPATASVDAVLCVLAQLLGESAAREWAMAAQDDAAEDTPHDEDAQDR